ncbi:MAG TPA: hypothetical protein VIV12_26415 [Streptosporangiaceae bacterium]
MPDETVSAVTTIKALAEVIFEILADPASHAAIDGTGWVREALDHERLTAAGQISRQVACPALCRDQWPADTSVPHWAWVWSY